MAHVEVEMSQALTTRPMGGRHFRLKNSSPKRGAVEAHLQLLLARVSDETGVPFRHVDVQMETTDGFAVFAPQSFLDCLQDDPAIELVGTRSPA